MDHQISPPVGDRERPLSSIHAYVTAWVAAGAGVGLTVWLVTGGATTASMRTALVLLVLTAVAEAVSLNLRSGESGVTLSLLETAVVIDLLLLGPTQALLVMVGGITLQHIVVRRLPPLKLIFNVGQHAVGVGLAVLIVALAPAGPEVGIERVIAVSVGVLVSRMVSTVALAGVFSRLGAPELRDHLTHRWLTLGATTLGNASLGVIAVVMWMSSPEVVWVVAGPALALHLAYSAGYRIEDLLADVRVQRDRLERVVDGVREGIVLLDAEGRILIWNRAMTTFLDVTETDAVGRSAADLLTGLDEHGFEIDPRALLRGAGEEARMVEAEVEAADGERVPLRLAHTLLWDDGRCTGDVVVVYDLRREREADSLKEDFVARVSHELRTPLSPLRGYAQALRKAGDGVALEKRNEILDVMVERVGHLERLVNDLLLVSQIGSGGVDLARQIQLEAVDLDELLPRLVSWLGRDQTRDHAIEIVGDGTGHEALADATRVGQILTNLLTNACKYSRPGAPVTVRLSHLGSEVQVIVEDEGEGIPPDKLDAIFKRFERLDDPQRMRAGGIGLGLYIARQLAEAMHGTLTVVSERGRGSAFTLALPTVRQAAGAASSRAALSR